MAEFGIGLTLEGITDLASLDPSVGDPRSAYQEYVELKKLGSRQMKGIGLPVALWEFPVMTVEEYNELMTFCTGASAEVYIRTKKNDDTYADFQATMVPPLKPERWAAGVKMRLEFAFIDLVEIEESS